MSNKLIDTYKRSDGGSVWLQHDSEKNSWIVTSFDSDDNVHWSLNGKKEGGRYEGDRHVDWTWVPFDEDLARTEFERWRD